MNRYFELSEKVYDITERYPQVLDLLISKGFDNLRNETMRKTLGKAISLDQALKMRKIDIALFEAEAAEILDGGELSLSDGLVKAELHSDTAQMSIEGVLPCPVKLQLLEKIEKLIEDEKIDINMDLQSASLGLDPIIEKVRKSRSADDLADIYISAGFNLFFDKDLIGPSLEQGVFADQSGWDHINPDFENASIDLRDPLKRYSIIGVVPAVMVVNTAVLGDRPMPSRWEDLLAPEFRNSISLPVRDLDMFNALMLGWYKLFGFDGIRKLGENLLEGMHPAQMVKGAKSAQGTQPAVSIAPWFFAQMAKESGPLKTVWPEEGAIVSPIFLITKASARERIKPVVDFLYSKDVAETIYVDGKFPSTNPALDNRLTSDQKFVWIGWDVIHHEDVGKLLRDAEAAFFNQSNRTILKIGARR